MNRVCRLALCFALLARAQAVAASGLEDAADVLRVALPLYAGAWSWREDDAAGTRQWITSTALTLGTTYALKAAVSKERPDESDDDAFPSGHAAAAFSSATFLHRRYGARVALPAYALATWTAWSRVQTDDHDTLDVAASAALAAASAWWLVTPRDNALAVYPVVGDDAIGIAFSGRY